MNNIVLDLVLWARFKFVFLHILFYHFWLVSLFELKLSNFPNMRIFIFSQNWKNEIASKFFYYISCVNSNCLKDPAVFKRDRRPTTKKLESTEFLCQIEGCNSQPFLGKSKLRGRPVVFSLSLHFVCFNRTTKMVVIFKLYLLSSVIFC